MKEIYILRFGPRSWESTDLIEIIDFSLFMGLPGKADYDRDREGNPRLTSFDIKLRAI